MSKEQQHSTPRESHLNNPSDRRSDGNGNTAPNPFDLRSDGKHEPPRWSQRLLRFFLREAYLEEIEGDIDEVFGDYLEQYSVKKARRLYSREVIKAIRPALTKRLISTQKLNRISMLRHNLLITFRGFRRHKTTFLINLVGLSTGLAASLLILLWVDDEKSVNSFHEKDDQLYQVLNHFQQLEGKEMWDYVSGRTGRTMKADFPEVEDAVWIGEELVSAVVNYDQSNYELDVEFASTNFFEVLSYRLLSGKASDVISNNQSIVISEPVALKIFGSVEAAIGKTVDFQSRKFEQEFIVTGVFESPPSNATRQFDAVFNYDILIKQDSGADEWSGGYSYTYVVIKKGTDIQAFNAKIENFMDDKVGDEQFTVFVQKYSERYLHGEYKDGVLVGGKYESVRLYGLVAILILVIASINFMNLSTAQASRKMKEIGVKKTIGANRLALMMQFMLESLMVSILALVISSILVYLLLPQFNLIMDKNIVLDFNQHFRILIWTTLGTGLLAGSYPAFYLSGFNPVAVLKGKPSNLKGEEIIRKGLVIVQFTLSIIFIIGVIVINRQIKFAQNKDLGYDRNNTITFKSKGLGQDQILVFLDRLKNVPGIIGASNMAGEFLDGTDSGSGYWVSKRPELDAHHFKSPAMGYNAIETLGLNIIAGRSFDPAFNDHDKRIIVNESAAKLLGLENAAGTRINYGRRTYRDIIGVVEDFQYGSLHQPLEPLIIRFRESGNECIVKLQRGTELTTLQRIEALYKEFHPKYHFEASYLEDDYRALYKSEENESVLSNYMAGIAIIISCLGLFALAMFTAERRAKEIGIRKILGASRTTIVRLLTQNFTKTVITSIILAIPLSYFFSQNWLSNFAYSIDLKWWFFAISGAIALLVAWLTVGFQTFKAATLNPAQSLRNE